MTAAPARATARRALAGTGALVAAASVALAAYAAHGDGGMDRASLQLAAVFALGHGVALAALAPRAEGRTGLLALALLLSGIVLFAGSLAAAQLAGASTRLAPVGGVLLIGGWLLHAVVAMGGDDAAP